MGEGEERGGGGGKEENALASLSGKQIVRPSAGLTIADATCSPRFSCLSFSPYICLLHLPFSSLFLSLFAYLNLLLSHILSISASLPPSPYLSPCLPTSLSPPHSHPLQHPPYLSLSLPSFPFLSRFPTFFVSNRLCPYK